MLESPDYFFRVREIGRLRQTRPAPVVRLSFTSAHTTAWLGSPNRFYIFLCARCLLTMSLVQQYSSSLGVKDYLRTYYSSVEQDWITEFRVKSFKNFFEKYSSKWKHGGSRLLDFSAGAVIINYISAAPHVTEIFHAAHTEVERNEVQLWLNDTKGAHDWNPFLQYVLGEVEGLKGDVELKERVALLRSKVKVISCNIFDECPIDAKENEGSFSIICSSLALEGASKTYSEFKLAIKKLVKLLKLGGYIAILFDEQESFYFIGGNKITVLPLSLEQLKGAVEEAGCVVVMSERDPTPIHLIENPTQFDQKACVFLAAYKVKE